MTEKAFSTKIQIALDIQGNMSVSDVARKHGVGIGTLDRIKKRLDQWLKIADEEKGVKHFRTEKFDVLDEHLVTFLGKAGQLDCIVTGPILKEAAKRIAKNYPDLADWEPSNGCLQTFRERNLAACKSLVGEKASVPLEIAEDYIENRLPEVLASYEPHNIFNADETGLLWKYCDRQALLLLGSDKLEESNPNKD